MQTGNDQGLAGEPLCELMAEGCLIHEFCPFYVGKTRDCRLAAGRGIVDEKKLQRCCSDDYDDCPTYLAFLLRRSRPLRRDSDWLDAI